MIAPLIVLRPFGRRLFLGVLVLVAGFVGSARALEVQVRGAFSGVGSLALTFNGQELKTATSASAFEGVISLSPDVASEVMITAVVSSYELRFVPPTGYQMMIEGLRQNTYTQESGYTGPLRIVLVKSAGDSSANDPLGEASSLLWHPPRVSAEPSWPFVRFNIGAALNGEALPALVVPLRARFTSTDAIPVPTISSILEMIYTPAAGGFHLIAPQVTVDLVLAGTDGQFTVKFSKPGATTSFVEYDFEFTPRAGFSDSYFSGAKVTKRFSSSNQSYETKLTGEYDVNGMRGFTLAYPAQWSVEDWHKATESVVRVVKVERNYDRSRVLGPVPTVPTARDDVFSDVVETRESDVLVGKERRDYRQFDVPIGRDVNNNIITATYIQPTKITEGYDVSGTTPSVTRILYEKYSPQQVGEVGPTGHTSMEEPAEPGISVTRRRYDTWLDAAPQQSTGATDSIIADGSLVTEESLETSAAFADFNLPTFIRRKIGSGTTEIKLSESAISYSQEDAGSDRLLIVTDRSDYAVRGTIADPFLRTVVKSFRPDLGPELSFLRGRVYSQQNPDGTKTCYAYERGTTGTYTAGTQAFTPSSDGPDLRITLISGTASGGTAITAVNPEGDGSRSVDAIGVHAKRSIMTVEIQEHGFIKHRNRYVCSGATGTPTWARVGYDHFTYTDDGRITERTSSNGTRTATSWTGSIKNDDTDIAGVVTTYTTDAMDRVINASRPSVGGVPAMTTTFSYPAAGKNVRSVAIGAAAGEQLVTTSEFDAVGRLVKTTQPGGVSASIAYSTDIATGDRVVTTTTFAGTTEEKSFPDGRVKSVGGTSAVAQFFDYTFDTEKRATVTVHSGSASGRSRKATFDMLGRVTEESTPGFGASGEAKPMVKRYHYNDLGQLDRIESFERSGTTPTEKSLSEDTILSYDVMGQLTASGLDLTHDGELTEASADRFSKIDRLIDQIGGDWWATAETKVFRDAGSATADIYKSQTRLSGFSGGLVVESVTVDSYNNSSRRTVTVDSSTHLGVETLENADGTRTVRTLAAGFTTRDEFRSDAAVSESATRLVTTYEYDALGRMKTSTNPRNIVCEPTYWPGTAWVKDALSGSNEDAKKITVTSYEYDEAGRVRSVTDANNATTTTTYTPRGQVESVTGAGAMPVTNVYNVYGEQTEQWTYRTAPFTETNADKTFWDYDDNTGWLTKKTDALGKHVDYSYTYNFAAGEKIVTRTSARNIGNNPNNALVATTYRYENKTGDLRHVEYNDGTHGVDYTYYRDGQPWTVSDVTGQRTFHYSHGQVLDEMLDDSFYRGLIISPQYETGALNRTAHTLAGRYRGVALGYAGTAADLEKELTTTLHYDGFGRMGSIDANYAAQASRAALGASFSYQYKPQTSFWESVAHGNFSVSRQLETGRDVLKSISARYGPTGSQAVVSEHVNVLTRDDGMRDTVRQSGSAFDDLGLPTFNQYRYDTRGQVQQVTGFLGVDAGPKNADTTRPIPGRDFRFNYDQAGNRLDASVDSETVNYTSETGGAGANRLNQVVNRGILRPRVSGVAHHAATVKVDNQPALRPPESRPFDAALPRFAQAATVTIEAEFNGVTTSTDASLLSRPANEALEYDADGNLIRDGLWAYTWDAEDRLISMSTRLDLGYNPAPPFTKLDFFYDYRGRRVAKHVAITGQPDRDYRYVYDGWNLIAEVDGPTGQIMRSHIWGLDPASDYDRTGAAGALLLSTDHTTATLTPFDVAHDGVGNVTALIGADGALAAAYEYDPFGQLLRASGPRARENPFGWSGKFTDRESGLVYYGLRLYDPGLGRWLNRDPIGESGGPNLYGFVGNSPANSFDVLGMETPVKMDPYEVVTTRPKEEAFVPFWVYDEDMYVGKIFEATDTGFAYKITKKGEGPNEWYARQTLAGHVREAIKQENLRRIRNIRATLQVEAAIMTMPDAKMAASMALARVLTDVTEATARAALSLTIVVPVAEAVHGRQVIDFADDLEIETGYSTRFLKDVIPVVPAVVVAGASAVTLLRSEIAAARTSVAAAESAGAGLADDVATLKSIRRYSERLVRGKATSSNPATMLEVRDIQASIANGNFRGAGTGFHELNFRFAADAQGRGFLSNLNIDETIATPGGFLSSRRPDYFFRGGGIYDIKPFRPSAGAYDTTRQFQDIQGAIGIMPVPFYYRLW